MLLTDMLIQKKIREGDRDEFERLFKKYYAPLCRFSAKIIGDIDTAEDIVQEFFYKLWKNRNELNIRLSLNAYLYQSVRLNSLHYLEHLAVRQKYNEEIKHEQSSVITAAETVTATELNKAIETALANMPERCSYIFFLNRFEGKKYREIAEMLSISIKTVEADMGKALQFFRESLKEYINSPL